MKNEFKDNHEILYESSDIEKIALSSLSKITKEERQWFPVPLGGEVNLGSRIDLDKISITQEYLRALDSYLDKALNDFTGFNQEKCRGFVVALSGGIDSAINTCLLQGYCNKKQKDLKVVIMGQGNSDVSVDNYQGPPAEWMDIQYAKIFCRDMNLPFRYIDIKDEYDQAGKHYNTPWTKSSQLPRIRANHLYSMATEHDLISVGSTNGSEYILTAFSTGGPAGDISPLIDLYKTEVYAIARDIGMPDYIMNRKPLISEMNIDDYSLYGGENNIDSTLIDPILRRVWYLKQSADKVSEDLGHGQRWIQDIIDKRIEGESSRRSYGPLVINRPIEFRDIKPNLEIDRSYFL